MTTSAVNSFVYKVLSLSWLTGPIFDKELRVSSRRKRNYLLRFAYILVLSIFILSIWFSIIGTRNSGPAVYVSSRLSQAGRQIIITIAWFQFIACQLIAVVMLSSSISDEIRTGTLNVLLTTPISSFQIVTGKLLSKLLQLILLLAISLPLLAIVRILGGVSWDYVVSNVCITLAATVLAGALSLWFSLNYRHTHIVIVVTILFYLVIFGALPGLFNVLAVCRFFIFSQDVTQSILALTNPFWAFTAANAKFLFQSGIPGYFSWPLHCLITLVLAVFVLALSIQRVRRVALGEAFGEVAKPRFGATSKRKVHTSRTRYKPIRPVIGPPIVWKEMHVANLGQGKEKNVMLVLLVGAFVMSAIIILSTGNMRQVNVASRIVPYLLMSGLFLVIMVRLAVFSAGSVTMEKEARTWPILLTTPLGDNEIIRGKAIAAFRRNMPLILIYFGLLCIRDIQIQFAGLRRGDVFLYLLCSPVFSACSIMGSVFFVIGSGLYFGVRLKSTTTAVAATAVLYFGVVYLFCGMFNPVRFLIYRMGMPGGLPWLFYIVPFVIALIKTGIGLSFAKRATYRLRRDIF